MNPSQDGGKEDTIAILNWTSGILKLLSSTKFSRRSQYFLSGKVLANVILFLGRGVPEVADDRDGGLLTFVFVDRLEVLPCNMGGGPVLDVDFVTHVLGNEMLGIVVVLLPVVMTNWILRFVRLLNPSTDVWLYLA